MTDNPQAEPWPAWVRYSLIAVLVVVGLVAASTQFKSGVSGAVLRTVIAAVLIPALLVPLQFWGIRRRSQQLRGRLTEELDALLSQIEHERTTEPPRGGGVDASLGPAAETVRRARELLDAGADHEAAALVEGLGSATGTALSGDLARQQRACVKTARTLAKISRRAQPSRL